MQSDLLVCLFTTLDGYQCLYLDGCIYLTAIFGLHSYVFYIFG